MNNAILIIRDILSIRKSIRFHTNGLKGFASLFFDICSYFQTALVEITNHYSLLASRISLIPLNYEIITSTDLYPMNISSMETGS